MCSYVVNTAKFHRPLGASSLDLRPCLLISLNVQRFYWIKALSLFQLICNLVKMKISGKCLPVSLLVVPLKM